MYAGHLTMNTLMDAAGSPELCPVIDVRNQNGRTDAAWLDFGASVLPFIYVGPNRYFGNFIDI